MKKQMVVALIACASMIGPVYAAGDAPVATDGAKDKPVVVDLAEGQRAQRALEELINAYQTGNVTLIRNRLDPSMIGYQQFIDGVVQDSNRFKQIRINLSDVQVLAGPDVAVIQTNWEKRFLTVSGLQPQLFSGHSMFLLHLDHGQWRVAAFGGDNLFSSQSGVLGQISLTVTPGVPGLRGGTTAPTAHVVVIDPDMTGSGTVTVQYEFAGLTGTVALTETLPGRFENMSTLSVRSGSLLTVKYLDSNPGGGRPPSVLTKSVMAP